jgi:microcystin-dependent protein
MSLTKITNKSLAPLTVLNANIAENTINGSKLAASTVTRDKLASDALDSNPIGTVIYYAGNTAPTGYLIANGSILDRTVYADLFAAIGTLHNIGSESATQFRIPDLRGEFIRGWDQGRNVDPNRVFGSFEDYATARPKKFDHTQRLAQPDASTNNFNTGANAPHLAGFVRVTRVGENLTANGVDTPGSGYEIDVVNALDGDDETRPRNVALLPCIKFSNGAMLSQTALNVQALADTKLNRSGGTITGDLTVNGTINNGGPSLLKAWCSYFSDPTFPNTILPTGQTMAVTAGSNLGTWTQAGAHSSYIIGMEFCFPTIGGATGTLGGVNVSGSSSATRCVFTAVNGGVATFRMRGGNAQFNQSVTGNATASGITYTPLCVREGAYNVDRLVRIGPGTFRIFWSSGTFTNPHYAVSVCGVKDDANDDGNFNATIGFTGENPSIQSCRITTSHNSLTKRDFPIVTVMAVGI